MRTALLAFALVACAQETSQPAPIAATPRISSFAVAITVDDSAAELVPDVGVALETWRAALERQGCALTFDVDRGEPGPGAILVRDGSDLPPEAFGFYADRVVSVRPGLYPEVRRRVLTHELGHALGLEHSGSGLMREHPDLSADEVDEADAERLASIRCAD